MHKTIAAAGFPDNLFMPTSVSRMATSVWTGNIAARSNWLADLKNGVSTEFYHSFNPTLYVQLSANAAPGNNVIIPCRVDLEYDVVVRGLRRVNQMV